MSKSLFAVAISFALVCSSASVLANKKKDYTYTHFELQKMRPHWEPEFRGDATGQKQTLKRFVIQLQSAPVASMGKPDTPHAMSMSTQGLDDEPNTRVSQLQQQLDIEFQQFYDALNTEGIEAQITHRFTTLFNGVAISGHNLDPSELADIPSVKAVYPERIYTTHMDTSPDLVQAASLWQQLGSRSQAGQGVKIAVIDSGIFPEHPMFSDEGFIPPASHRPQNDYCAQVDSTFCNNKLISARWISPTFPVWKDEYLTPRGFNTHGTHVAGIAAGNPVTTQFEGQNLTLSGIAPGAYLMVYKTLYATANNPDSASGSNIMLLEALEHAVNDGADVINNSWGGAVGLDPALSPFKAAFEMAEAAGIVMVSSAGNSGPGANTIGCPGCIEAGITVANSSHGRFIHHVLEVDGLEPISARLAHSDYPHHRDIRAPITTAQNVDPNNNKGCLPFPFGSLQGHIVVVQRGECAFIEKAQNLSAAGAVGMIVFNDRPAEPVIMLMPSTPIPAAMIGQSDGAEILSHLAGQTAASAVLSGDTVRLVVEAFADHIAPSSSRGPNGDPTILKPDITAPGSYILSAIRPQQESNANPLYAMLSGTSMAAPQISGAAALLRQEHPDWSAIDIKTALTSTSYRDHLRKENNTSPVTPFDVGAGRLDLNAARLTTLTFDKASYANPTCIAECQFKVVATNRGNEEAQWEVMATLADAEVSVSPHRLSLPPNQSGEVSVTIDATHMSKDQWHYGELQFSGANQAHLPLAILPTLSSNSGMTSLYGDKPTLAFGEHGDYHARFSNTSFDDEIAIELTISPGVVLDRESIHIRSNGSSGGRFEYEESSARILWQGLLDTQVVAITPTHISGLVSQAQENNRVSCLNSCDEYSFVYRSAAQFEYNGEDHQLLTISSNGFMAAGETQIESGWRNQKLADLTPPNNVIAPFWTDLNLLGDEEPISSSSGGGSMHLYEVLDDQGDPIWIVVDWIDVQVYGDSNANQYSFGVWLGTGPNKGTNLMKYYELDTLPPQLTVGAEERHGNVGNVRYFNGEGFAPKVGDTLRIATHPAGNIEIDFALSNEAAVFNGKRQMQTQEDMPLSIDAGEIHAQLMDVPVVLSVKHHGSQLQAMQLIELLYPEVSDITISDQPKNGTVQLDEEHLNYHPYPDFNGEDTLQYMMKDNAGNVLGFVDIELQVAKVNDPPVVDPIAEQRLAPGQSVEISLSATDVEGDSLSWRSTQLSGPQTRHSVQGSKLQISAPETESDAAMTFSIVANDGQHDSEPVIAQMVASGSGTQEQTPIEAPGEESAEERAEEGGGGSLNGWLWLLPLMILFRRLIR